jgi:hypothetical protein
MRERTAQTAVATSAAARPVMVSPAGGVRIPATVSAHPVAAAMVRPATVGARVASVLAATEPALAPATVSAQVVAIAVPPVLLVMVRVRLVRVRVRLVTVSVPVVTAAQVLLVMVRARLVRVSVPEATGAARAIAAVTDRLGTSRSVVGSTATRDAVGTAEIATGSGRAADAVDVTRSCGRGKAAPHEAIGMRVTENVNSPKRSGWRGSCGPFGLGTTILTSPTTSNRAISTRVRGSS